MISLKHIYKYYNYKKVNQLTVCNDVSLDFESKGLAVILGASGSGKTTLLNVISGMDAFDRGTLIFDGEIFHKYRQSAWDKIRKHSIGYVYQNYHLLKNRSVYQNIEPVFKMLGYTDEHLIREKVIKLLDSVGMAAFIDRLVKQLSGGQQQRIAFARALANNPKVILADEPTGNLDGKTTIELMNVLKQISKTRLVIMVTHEKKISQVYADRIIHIEDGKIISDEPNDTSELSDIEQEHIITLSDFDKTTSKAEELHVNRYTTKGHLEPLDIHLIERNQTLYVKIDSDTIKRTKYIDDDSEIIVREKRDASVKENPFDLNQIYQEPIIPEHKKHFTIKDTFAYALKQLNLRKKRGKMLFLVLFLLGIIISLSVGLIGEIAHVEEPFEAIDTHYITVHMDRTEYDNYQGLADVTGVDQLMLVNQPYLFSITTPKYYQTPDSVTIEAQPIDIQFFDESTLIYGQMAEPFEVIIDRRVADDIIDQYSNRGVKSYRDVLNCAFKIQASGKDSSVAEDAFLSYSISGIADTNALSVWMDEALIYSIVTPSLIDASILGEGFEIVEGALPEASTYIMLNENYPSVRFDGETPYNIGISTGTYYISGIYRYTVDGVSYDLQKLAISQLDFVKSKYFKYQYHRFTDFDLLVYATDVDIALEALENAGYDAEANLFEPTVAQQIKLEEHLALYWLGLGGILLSALIIFLIMRSSLIARMYEISVYRSIGVTIREIKRMFFFEICLTTTLSTVLGFLFMVIVLNQAQSSLDFVEITYFNSLALGVVILGIYLINTGFGLIPVHRLLRKSPATIMKQNDL